MLTQENVSNYFAKQKPSLCNTHTKRFAFYQAGRSLVQTLLFNHPKISLLKLTESNNLVCSTQGVPKQNFGQGFKSEGSAKTSFLHPSLSPIETRTNLETLLIGFYAGKAGERFTGSTKTESDVSFSSLKYKNQVVSQCFTHKKEVVVRKTQRKYLVYVNGLFANGTTFQAKRDLETTVPLSQIRYICGTLSELGVERLALQGKFGRKETGLIYPKLTVTSKPGYQISALMPYQNKVLIKRSFGRTYRTVRYTKNRNKSGSSDGITSSSLCSPYQRLLVNKRRAQLDRFKMESFLWQSNTGLLERIKAALLVKSLLFKGSIYLPNLFNLQKNNIVGHLNKIEIQDKKSLDLLKDLEEQTTNIYLRTDKQNRLLHSKNFSLTHSYKKGLVTKARSVTEFLNSQAFQYDIFISQLNKSSQTNSLLFSKKIDSLSQKKERSVWCEESVCKSLTSSIKRYGHWFRIYLPQIETHQQLAKTSFLHSVSSDQFFKKRRELGLSEYIKVSPLRLDCVKDLGTRAVPNTAKITSFSVPPFYAPSKISFLSVLPLAPTKFLDEVNCYYNFICRPTKISFWSKSQAFARTKVYLPYQNEVLVKQVPLQSFKRYAVPAVSERTVSTVRTAQKREDWSGLQKVQVSNKFESITQLEMSSHLKISPEALEYVWPQELGSGLCHQLILNVFSRALNLLNKNRELLDILADHLIRFEKIRVPEISRICSLYVETGVPRSY